jgi:uncharacterized BrkB/YihY/UPF0761 family membrane protein
MARIIVRVCGIFHRSFSDVSEHRPRDVQPAEQDRTDGEQRAGASTTWGARAAEVRARAEQVRQQLEGARPRSRPVDVLFVSLQRDTLAGGPVLAAAIAFRIFLFVVPYVFVVVYGFGLTASAIGADPQDLARKAGVVGLLASTITVSSTQSLTTRIVVFVTVLYALISTSRSFLKVLFVAHVLAWRVPPVRPRHLLKAALVFILVVTSAFIALQLIARLRDRSLAGGLVAEVLFLAVPTSLWLLLSQRFFAHAADATWRDLLPGAVLVGVGVQVVHFVTIYWITHLLESKSQTYGAIGAALAILFWAYLLGRVFAAAAVLNAGTWQQRHDRPSLRT